MEGGGPRKGTLGCCRAPGFLWGPFKGIYGYQKGYFKLFWGLLEAIFLSCPFIFLRFSFIWLSKPGPFNSQWARKGLRVPLREYKGI